MKKIIALLLALMMVFSLATVAFAEGEEAEVVENEKTAEEIIEEFSAYITENADTIKAVAGAVGPTLKLVSFALKFLKVYITICGIFGIDPVDTAKAAVDYFAGILAGDEQILKDPIGSMNPNLAA